ncbi:hypothetical protein BCR41DRAFT_390501 [Lobosporangium transversale]|uniref:Uncharacterized protein n=1 Tax=Lobosporangium transversale TaxID=64571 RepID=A0A1Y2G6N3_9FUNG|nr:hypothetical protein BCR41DRAFT_390501 [Lobosporangium transversale]ORY98422.1 hypothetical protein BCR41DRAFT_390501 [Lobosporangium transversale]|eukprot:XP_021875793.1 hypothetical protein BCR41DRAFT_390501 [Lobosporangium transversale]
MPSYALLFALYTPVGLYKFIWCQKMATAPLNVHMQNGSSIPNWNSGLESLSQIKEREHCVGVAKCYDRDGDKWMRTIARQKLEHVQVGDGVNHHSVQGEDVSMHMKMITSRNDKTQLALSRRSL